MTTKSLWVAGVAMLLSCRPAPERQAGESSSRDTPPVPVAPARPPEAPAPGPEATAPDDGCTPVWPSRVRLSGVLRAEEKLGPPGYGETPERDEKLTIYVLDLDQPRDVCADTSPDEPREAVRGAARMQLAGSVDPNRLKALVGRRIRVHGTLVHQVWGSDFTQVIVRVDSIPDPDPAPLPAA